MAKQSPHRLLVLSQEVGERGGGEDAALQPRNIGFIAAYQSGVPGNGKPFPDGSKMAKIHWNQKKSAEAPAPTLVPDTLHDVDFMVRDSKRFVDSGNWGYAAVQL